jgi:branched-chain amino acid transport system substrate-binding protein
MVEMKKTLFSILLVIALLALPISAACGEEEVPTPNGNGGTPTPVTPTEKILTIGGITFLTGPAAAGGLAFKQGCELAVDAYNAAGGLKVGNDTYTINLIIEDDAMSSDQAVTCAIKLLQSDGATFMVGPMTDALKTVVYPIVSENGALMAMIDSINVSGSLPFEGNADVSPDRPLLVRMGYAYDEATPYLLDYLVENYPDAKKVAVCGVVEMSLEVNYKWLKDELPAKGLERVGDLEQIAPDCSDYVPVMTRVLSSHPDAIFMPISTPVMFGFAVKAARELGFTGPMFTVTHQDISFQALLAGVGNDTDIFGLGLAAADTAGMPAGISDIYDAYVAKYGSDKDLITDVYLVGYSGMWVLLQTIEKAGSVDPQTVLRTYESLTTLGDLKTIFGDAYVGGIQTVGVNRKKQYRSFAMYAN